MHFEGRIVKKFKTQILALSADEFMKFHHENVKRHKRKGAQILGTQE